MRKAYETQVWYQDRCDLEVIGSNEIRQVCRLARGKEKNGVWVGHR